MCVFVCGWGGGGVGVRGMAKIWPPAVISVCIDNIFIVYLFIYLLVCFICLLCVCLLCVHLRDITEQWTGGPLGYSSMRWLQATRHSLLTSPYRFMRKLFLGRSVNSTCAWNLLHSTLHQSVTTSVAWAHVNMNHD